MFGADHVLRVGEIIPPDQKKIESFTRQSGNNGRMPFRTGMLK